ncbi:uncharacterized protein LOC115887505 [Sitophilus oryzae]|uniref:acid phosphatase n=1 Tax=Sitophilus oryzae TaxID=7048 RepID=A0A6J2YIY2_SITOR|nr:uncharacterized protein LOC115887505 [Sitophilus oryzae]
MVYNQRIYKSIYKAFLSSLVSLAQSSYDTSTLQLAHVLFRHGNRNPTDGIYESNPYYNESYYSEGYGQLTNTGKLTEYNLGSELRTRFSDFLTTSWHIDYLDVRSTNVNRTKMSAQAMLAGLYPARGSQIWSSLYWLPIPYNYYPSAEDKELLGQYACSNYDTLYESVVSSTEITDYLTRYKKLFAFITAYTELTGSLKSAFSLYFGFAAQEDVGYDLEDWTSNIYPEPLLAATVDLYYVYTNTTALRKIVAGFLLKKILSDTEAKINGTIDPTNRKMFIYSAHEMNVAHMLLTLGVEIHMAPPYGSYVLFELHLIDGVYGIKLFYQFYEDDDPVAFSLSGCDEFCPYDDFYSLVEDYIPTDDDCICGDVATNRHACLTSFLFPSWRSKHCVFWSIIGFSTVSAFRDFPLSNFTQSFRNAEIDQHSINLLCMPFIIDSNPNNEKYGIKDVQISEKLTFAKMFSSRVVFVAFLISVVSLAESSYDTSTLQLAHVLFRHGNRNPTDGIYADNPYYNESYYPEGYGQLTNTGKLTEYNMGAELRTRFDDFLTSSWNINYLDIRSTNVNRTKMSAQAMLAALYPARGSQIWSSLYWLPIPYNYYSSDKELQGTSACSNFRTLYQEVLNSTEISEYISTRYKKLFAIMEAYTDESGSLSAAFGMYFGFYAQEDVGYDLEDWTSLIYPDPLLSATIDLYYVYTNTTALRKIAAGFLLKKILSDTEDKINGTIDPSTRKMFIYSAHELNVANMLLTLGVEIHMAPPYGSYVLFELHLIDGVYGIKLFYQFYEEDDPVAFSLSGCDEFCPYDDFYSLVEDYIPTDDDCT